jgi:hypothetical protein
VTEIGGAPDGGYEIVLAPPPADQEKARELVAEITRRVELSRKREAIKNATEVPTK